MTELDWTHWMLIYTLFRALIFFFRVLRLLAVYIGPDQVQVMNGPTRSRNVNFPLVAVRSDTVRSGPVQYGPVRYTFDWGTV